MLQEHSRRLELLLMIGIGFVFVLWSCRQSELDSAHQNVKERADNLYIPEGGFVPDSETAIRVAEAVWIPIYGEAVMNKKPFKAELINDSLWIVVGTLHSGELGGVPYAEIQKADGRIVGVSHGK